MTVRRARPRPRTAAREKSSWVGIAGLVFNVCIVLLNALWAYSLFNNDTMQRIATIEANVDWLVKAENRRRDDAERPASR